MTDRKNGSDTDAGRSERGRFAAGNPGRPRGARNKTTVAVEALMEGEAQALTKVALEKAKAGDMTALRLCLDRIAPPRKDRPTSFPMPAIKSVQDHPSAIAAIIEAVSTGDLAPSEAEALCRMFGEHRKSVEIAELEARISKLEGVQ